MNYELALKLKNAGFPQHDEFGKTCYGDCYSSEGIHSPTPFELIEACGDDFGSLTQSYGDTALFKWKASDINHKKGFLAHTPEEAVAGLWLELNKK